MQLTTPIPIPKSGNPIGYGSRIVSLGSCFAVNMGQKLDYFKFRNTTNPFGILFHPLALEKFISYTLQGKIFSESDIFYHNARWHCFDAHSDLSHPDKDTVLANLNAAAALAHTEINVATHLIITLGTAWVYRHNTTGELVANCHKVQQKEFSKELLSAEMIKTSLQNIIEMIRAANPSAQIIFTLSPVRHIKDGFTENQWSKANLISALHEVLAASCDPDCRLSYFPSYEIMMDELRDYRFYDRDLVHPNQLAVDYIWERFAAAYIAPEALTVMAEADAIQKGLAHRPSDPQRAQHRDFLQKLHNRIAALQEQHPHIVF